MVILQKLSYIILFDIAQVICLVLAVIEGREISVEKNGFCSLAVQVIEVGRLLMLVGLRRTEHLL